MKKVVILGAGVGGLAAGYFLSRTGKFKVIVLEKEPVIGGLCGSFESNGFLLDYGAHKLYSVIPGILDEIVELMGDRLIKLRKKNRLFLKGQLVDYPLHLGNLAQILGLSVFLELGFGYAFSLFKEIISRHSAESYEEYMIQRFGSPAYELVFQPLADKVWGNPSGLHPDMARTRVPASGGLEVILKLLGIKKETAETDAKFFYYPTKGFYDFPKALKEKIEAFGGEIRVEAKVLELIQEENQVVTVRYTEGDENKYCPCDVLISSIPFQSLGQLIFFDTDSVFNQLVSNLNFRHLILVYIFVKRSFVLEDQWIFFPEKKYIFSRIFEQKQMNPALGPNDITALCCDFTCAEDNWRWQASDELLAEKCIKGLIEAGFIRSDEIDSHLVKRVKNFYPRYDLQYNSKLEMVLNKLKKVENLLVTGRIGMYNYNNADHCMDMGKFIVTQLADNISPRIIMDELRKRVKNYRIVD